MVRLILAFILMPLTVYAQGYVNSKSQWDEMSAWAKDGYVAGFIDGVITPFVGSDEQIAYTSDVTQCLVDLDLKSTALVELIDLEYQTLENWDKRPSDVLLIGLRRVCFAKINEYRKARGEELLQP